MIVKLMAPLETTETCKIWSNTRQENEPLRN